MTHQAIGKETDAVWEGNWKKGLLLKALISPRKSVRRKPLKGNETFCSYGKIHIKRRIPFLRLAATKNPLFKQQDQVVLQNTCCYLWDFASISLVSDHLSLLTKWKLRGKRKLRKYWTGAISTLCIGCGWEADRSKSEVTIAIELSLLDLFFC